MSTVAQIILMPEQNLTATIKSLEGRVERAVIGVYGNATPGDLPRWCQVKEVSTDFDVWRNANLAEQTLIIYPGEELESDLNVEGTYRVYVMDDQSVSKETRIVRRGDGKFVNPVYECFDTVQKPDLIEVLIRPAPPVRCTELLDRWIKVEPWSCEADYYKAFDVLADNDYVGFVRQGEYFLFRTGKKHHASVVMMRYYLGCILLVMGQANRAASYFLLGLEAEPTMAEFWCGIGDCFRKTGQREKAIRMYKNAIVMGKKRNITDDMPVILSMYEEYPTTKIRSSISVNKQ